MLAEVIVDVPSQNTDQTFTYRVPEEYELLVAPGMRITVPFGKGDRFIQGFIMSLSNDAKKEQDMMDAGILKDLNGLMDVEPVLNDELLQMADYLKETTFSFKIMCLQTMLPSVLKADYTKEFVATDALTPEEAEIFGGKKELTFEEAQAQGVLSKLARLKAQNKVEVNYHVLARDQVKTVRYVKSLVDVKKSVANRRTNRHARGDSSDDSQNGA